MTQNELDEFNQEQIIGKVNTGKPLEKKPHIEEDYYDAVLIGMKKETNKLFGGEQVVLSFGIDDEKVGHKPVTLRAYITLTGKDKETGKIYNAIGKKADGTPNKNTEKLIGLGWDYSEEDVNFNQFIGARVRALVKNTKPYEFIDPDTGTKTMEVGSVIEAIKRPKESNVSEDTISN